MVTKINSMSGTSELNLESQDGADVTMEQSTSKCRVLGRDNCYNGTVRRDGTYIIMVNIFSLFKSFSFILYFVD